MHLHADDFWGYVGTGRVGPWRPAAAALNATVMAAVAGAAAGYARGGLLVVVDCVVGPWLLGPFLRAGLPLHHVVLRVDPTLAIARCRSRGGGTLTDPGPIADLNRRFRDLGERERHAIDMDGLAPEDTAAAVEAALASGRFRVRAWPSAPWSPFVSTHRPRSAQVFRRRLGSVCRIGLLRTARRWAGRGSPSRRPRAAPHAT